MEVNVRNSRLHSTRELDIQTAVHVRRKACLHAHFGGTHVHRFLRAAGDFLEGEEVTFFVAIRAAESTEPAMLHTDVRKVDVAVDDVSHHVADLAPAQLVGSGYDRLELRAGRFAEPERFLPRNVYAIQGSAENPRHVRSHSAPSKMPARSLDASGCKRTGRKSGR